MDKKPIELNMDGSTRGTSLLARPLTNPAIRGATILTLAALVAYDLLVPKEIRGPEFRGIIAHSFQLVAAQAVTWICFSRTRKFPKELYIEMAPETGLVDKDQTAEIVRSYMFNARVNASLASLATTIGITNHRDIAPLAISFGMAALHFYLMSNHLKRGEWSVKNPQVEVFGPN